MDDGRLRIDNNLLENAIRPFVVGRKNFLFCDTVRGANVRANLYSLIETAKANGIEPYQYLRRVFTELPDANTVEDIEALLAYRLDPPNTDNLKSAVPLQRAKGPPDLFSSDTAARAHDLDEAAALEAKRHAEQAIQDRSAQIDYAKALAEYAEAAAQLQANRAFAQTHGTLLDLAVGM